ncbi:hypothetical protein NUSPORA_01313 [Nucleospora cyclopteri]
MKLISCRVTNVLLYLFLVVLLIVFIIFHFRTRAFYIFGPVYGECCTMQRPLLVRIIRSPTYKHVFLDYFGDSKLKEITTDDLLTTSVFFSHVSKFKLISGDVFLAGIAQLNCKEGSMKVFGETFECQIYPIKKVENIEVLKSKGLADLYNILKISDLTEIPDHNVLLRDLSVFMFSPVPVKFVATLKFVWLSTPSQTRLYKIETNSHFILFLNAFSLKDPNALYFSGYLDYNRFSFNIKNYNMFTAILPYQIKNLANIQYTSDKINALNKFHLSTVYCYKKHLMLHNLFNKFVSSAAFFTLKNQYKMEIASKHVFYIIFPLYFKMFNGNAPIKFTMEDTSMF